MKWYGNLMNRLEEGKKYGELVEGADITMYCYSDRDCYYVTKVVDEKHIFVKPYHVCADQEKERGMGHQDWIYFKTTNEMNEYLKKFYPENEYTNREDKEEEWCFRNNKWKKACHRSFEDVLEDIKERKEYDKEIGRARTEEEYLNIAVSRFATTKTDIEKLKAGKAITTYHDLSGKISIGVRDYYYDWEF